MENKQKFVVKFEEVGIGDVGTVGGKNASLGEMIQSLIPKGIKIPSGFIVTAEAYRFFLEKTGLDKFIETALNGLNTKNLADLAKRGKKIRDAIKKTELPVELKEQIIKAYKEMEDRYGRNTDTAVRSSATAEDLPGASFAGEHDTFLNIKGKDDVIGAVRAAMASLFTDRAISYRVDKGFDHLKVALSVGVQKMIRSDLGCSGVMFTLDTESGFRDLIVINGAWGLGELIVQGEVTPDEFLIFKKNIETSKKPIIDKRLGVKNQKMIYKEGTEGLRHIKLANTSEIEKSSFTLKDEEILQLAKWGAMIEEHYSNKNNCWMPMDIEWAKDGRTNELYIVQARPETIHAKRDFTKIKEYIRKEDGEVIVKGASVGSKIASGKSNVILDVKGIKNFKKGEVLITDMTDPDWEPVMKIASAIVTDKGGRTSHAAIVSRELGIPCVVGTESATKKIKTGDLVTVDTTSNEGLIFKGSLKFEIVEHDVKNFPRTCTKIMMNIGTPDTAFEKSFLPNDGVGLAREEFIIASNIGIHPMALINYAKIKSQISNLKNTNQNSKIIREIEKKTVGYKDKTQFYVDKLAYGVAKIGAAFYPKPVIVRFSDFKTNEYRTLTGGDLYEPKEENPMIGWRGASRYYNPNFIEAFALECKAIKKVREEMGLVNIIPMIPFCRTPEEGRKVIKIMADNGLDRRKDKELKIYVMCEIPSNIILADAFLEIFDGMSIGSNDLTQLTVGIDRDGSELLRGIANENDASIRELISVIIKKCKEKGKYIGICGQGPSDMPDFAEFLIDQEIDSMSLNPDTVVKTTLRVYEREKKQKIVVK